MKYSVGKVAVFAGVTVRTLHHYEEIGLLCPSDRSPSGYRLYDDADLERLQQILFYRALGFSLEDIGPILEGEADTMEHLRTQHRMLLERTSELQRMVAGVEKAMEDKMAGTTPSPEQRFAALTVTSIDLPLERLASGKVREIFELGPDRLLFVATDRISAHDVIMTQGIPDKGKLLTAMSLLWFDLLKDVCPNHLSGEAVPASLNADLLAGRSLVVRRLEMLPVEFVVRGYLTGSGWKDYKAAGAVCGIPLPPGLQESQQLDEPIFTPATKATTGHDENISEDIAADLVGPDVLKVAKGYALEAYRVAAEYAVSRGIILADTKFEFGTLDGEVIMGDEVLTPDSSRFWPAESWEIGKTPPSFDKQYLRDWLNSTGWDQNPPPPDLPPDVVAATRARYIDAYEALTGTSFDRYLAETS
ncbi:MAG: phosphoribosylaminoimidazolesuccinocarboxamide synthase [Actinobacteria bacterium]|nr:phosphoribosylaminoimidazolesuccinocarboxamide synthase [Actinomycetota bacterium]